MDPIEEFKAAVTQHDPTANFTEIECNNQIQMLTKEDVSSIFDNEFSLETPFPSTFKPIYQEVKKSGLCNIMAKFQIFYHAYLLASFNAPLQVVACDRPAKKAKDGKPATQKFRLKAQSERVLISVAYNDVTKKMMRLPALPRDFKLCWSSSRESFCCSYLKQDVFVLVDCYVLSLP